MILFFLLNSDSCDLFKKNRKNSRKKYFSSKEHQDIEITKGFVLAKPCHMNYHYVMNKEVFVGSEGVGDRFVQAGTLDLFKQGSAVLTSLICREISGGDLDFRIVECENRFPGDSSETVKRFGDRCYKVQKEVGSA